jgi:hypothetical protein
MIKKCVNCERLENEIPLIEMTYRNKPYFICPQCLPVLIHKPQTLAGKLPDADKFPSADHEH